jgi:hypothetical protein
LLHRPQETSGVQTRRPFPAAPSAPAALADRESGHDLGVLAIRQQVRHPAPAVLGERVFEFPLCPGDRGFPDRAEKFVGRKLNAERRSDDHHYNIAFVRWRDVCLKMLAGEQRLALPQDGA